jgi:predicted acetyltransferase
LKWGDWAQAQSPLFIFGWGAIGVLSRLVLFQNADKTPSSVEFEELLVPITLRDARNSPDGRRWIEGVFPEYLDALSAVTVTTGIFPIRGEFGDREPDLLARWFGDDGSYPFTIQKDNKPVGFAVVSRPLPSARAKVDYRMAEFFVIKKQRRLGVGRDAAKLILRRFSGRWEVTELQSNQGAVAFWRSVLQELAPKDLKERLENGEIKQYFDSGALVGT